MKTPEQVGRIMQAIPADWRHRWCGGERGDCACMGCVQIGNRAVIAEKIFGEPYRGDPEYIDEAKLQAHGTLYTDNKVTREEWEAWVRDHPEANQQSSAPPSGSIDGLIVIEGKTGAGKSTVLANLIAARIGAMTGPISVEGPIERKPRK